VEDPDYLICLNRVVYDPNFLFWMMVLDISAKVLEIIPHSAGQGNPPNVSLRAIDNMSSNIVKLSVTC
jgi:hypothetical protein